MSEAAREERSTQHTDPTAHRSTALEADRIPVAGPIAVLPEASRIFVDAVERGGGVVSEVSRETRGIVWLSDSRADDLVAILREHEGIGWVQLPWAGVDAFAHVLADAELAQRIVWTSAKGAYAEPVAEMALALTLATLRDLPRKVRTETWARPKTGRSLYGAHVVIVGAGGIAEELIRLLAPFRTRVTIVRRAARAVEGADRTVTSEHLDEVLPSADVVILAAASTTETRGMLDRTRLASMKPTAVVVNVARGALIDTDALVDALAAGTIAGAGLDVTHPEPLPDGHPLWSDPHCIITSHTADTPEMTQPLLAARIAANTSAFVSGTGRFTGLVDPAAGY